MKEIQKGNKVTYELSEAECRALIVAGDRAMENTYPEKGRGYAVALMTKAGNIYEGISYRSDTETLTMHSEATALAHAAIHGEKDVVAITGPNCHICKQLIYESTLRSGIDIVVVIEEKDQIRQVPISEMMPFPWPEEGEK